MDRITQRDLRMALAGELDNERRRELLLKRISEGQSVEHGALVLDFKALCQDRCPFIIARSTRKRPASVKRSRPLPELKRIIPSAGTRDL